MPSFSSPSWVLFYFYFFPNSLISCLQADGFCHCWPDRKRHQIEMYHCTEVYATWFGVTAALLTLNIGKVWLKKVDDSGTSKKRKKKKRVPKCNPNVSKFVFTELWGLSRTLIIISWVCFLDELFPHAVSSHNERSLFLLCLHHNDGSFSCASYLFLTTCKAVSLPQSFSAVSPPLVLSPPPSLALSLCSSWQGYSLLNTQTAGAPPWAH